MPTDPVTRAYLTAVIRDGTMKAGARGAVRADAPLTREDVASAYLQAVIEQESARHNAQGDGWSLENVQLDQGGSVADARIKMQRRLESAIREQEAIRDTAKASGDDALVKRCNERIKVYQDKYNQISEITGIPKDTKRMSVPKSENVWTSDTKRVKMKLASNSDDASKTYSVVQDKDSVNKLQERIKTDLNISIVDFSELENADVATKLVDNIQILQEEHGQRFNAIIAQRPPNGAKDLIWVTPSRELVINPDYFNSKQAMDDFLEEMLANKMIPKGCKNIEFVAKHEYAHLITMEEINNSKSFVRTLFGRAHKNKVNFISQNARLDPYEFAADYLSCKNENEISRELKKLFRLEDF